MLKVGVIFSRLETIHSLSIQLTGDLNNNILKNTIDGEKNILKENVLDLPNLNWLENLELTCCAEFFFEVLCCGVREAGLKQQNLLFKSGTAFCTSLEKELNILKQNAVENKNLLSEKERTLALYNEEKIWGEVLENKRFENLNNKKMTPYFLSLVKGSKKVDSLSNIVDENGTPFNSDEERKIV